MQIEIEPQTPHLPDRGALQPRSRHAIPPHAERARERTETEALLLDNLGFIKRVIRSHCRRQALSAWDADDFESCVFLRLVERDYAVLRRFRGKSRMTTYLITVIYNAFQDFRYQRWGRWRPSSRARRMGELAIQLEALLYRDRLTLAEATEALRHRLGGKDAESIEKIAARLRPRLGRPERSPLEPDELAASERGDCLLEDAGRGETVQTTQRILNRALQELDPEDRLLLKMRFRDGMTVASIAGLLMLDQRRLYSRVDRLLRRLRSELERESLEKADITDVLGWDGSELTIDFGS